MACTIRDIAQAAGVSASTVSLVLRGKPHRISEETIQRIQKIARQMNYVPNQVAVSLVTKKTHTIGLIYSNMLNPFYVEMAVGVERNAQLHNYSLLSRYSSVPRILTYWKAAGSTVLLYSHLRRSISERNSSASSRKSSTPAPLLT